MGHTKPYLSQLNLLILHKQLPGSKISKIGLGLECYYNVAVLGTLSLIAGPEGVAGLVALLSEAAEHDHHLALELTHHPPQVPHCALHGALCCYVGSVIFVALERERVQ